MDSAIKPIEDHLQKMQKIQNVLSEIVNENNDISSTYHEIINILNKLKIIDNCYEFKSFLHLLSIICKDCHQKTDKMKIIEQILIEIKDDIQKHFQNFEIYSIFKSDKKIILFLLKSKILNIDNYVLNHLRDQNELIFFFPEVKEFLKKDEIKEIKEKIPKNFEEKRSKGENESYLCELIRKDSIESFITFMEQTNFSLSRQIDESNFETNPFLIDKNPTLIEYATFFGSIQIFQYLKQNNVSLTESLWIYAINSNNAEMINIIEENKIAFVNQTYKELYKESIQCHHNNIANYIQENYLQDENEIINSGFYFTCYNFEYIKAEFVDKSNFFFLCEFDYPYLVDVLLKYEDININEKDDNEFSALQYAIAYDNIEIAKILLSFENIDVESKYTTYMKNENNVIIQNCLVLNDRIVFIATSILTFISLILSFFDFSNIRIAISAILFFIYWCICFVFYDNFSFYLLPSILFKSLFSDSFLTVKKTEETILHLAIFNDNSEMVKLLLSNKNVDVNAVYKEINEDSITLMPALVLASMRNDDEIVKLLLSSNSNIDVNCIYENIGLTSFSWLCLVLSIFSLYSSNCYMSIIISILLLYILSHVSFFNLVISLFCFFSAIIIIILQKLSLLNLIISAKASSSIENIFLFIWYIWYIIIFNQLFELLYTLVYHYYEKKSSLHIAILNDNEKIVKLLLERNDIDLNLRYMIKYDNYNFADLQNKKSNFFDVFYNNETSLNLAIRLDNIEIIKLLLAKSNIDVNTENVFGSYKKLYKLEIVYFNIINAIESLISYAFFASQKEQKALNTAALKSNAEIVKLLLEKMPINSIKNEFKKLKMQKVENKSEKTSTEDHEENLNKFEENLNLIQQFIAENQH